MNRIWQTLTPVAVLAVMLTGAVPAFAQQESGNPPPAAAPANGVAWSSLSADQQKLLSRFGGQWNSLPPERQAALARGSQRWLKMSPEQRNLAHERFDRWHSLPPQQRDALRERWQKFQSLPPDEQAIVRQNFHRFQQLPPERRKALREQWHNATPAQRQEMLDRMREKHTHHMEQHPAPHMNSHMPAAPHAPRR